jgi:hypothetical protein
VADPAERQAADEGEDDTRGTGGDAARDTMANGGLAIELAPFLAASRQDVRPDR